LAPSSDNPAPAPFADPHINDSGMLEVGDGHNIYWVDWGKPGVETPTFFLHGGPGQGIVDAHFDYFNPDIHRVIFHDQRGSARSTPFASTGANTTQDLIGDIEKLRKSLQIDKLSLYGFSWGSTLSLLYAIAHPEHVTNMIIGGIFLARDEDFDFFLGGEITSHFPEAWERFVSFVPSNQKDQPSKYYKRVFEGNDEQLKKKLAKEWLLYEASILKLEYEPKTMERDLDKISSASLAYLEAHYLLNNCFIEENYILDNTDKIANIPTIILHGRYDFICKPSAAIQLNRQLPQSKLHIAASGHAPDPALKEATLAYIRMLWG
jgi:proline iminopeptidase